MAKYTIELRQVINMTSLDEVKSWFKDYNFSDYLTSDKVSVIINAGLFDKDKLAQKIINHYFVREIGLETIGLFKHYAKMKMSEIMEYYVPLIYSASINYDPLVNVDYTEEFKRQENVNSTSQGTSTSNSTNNSSGLEVSSDTPQGQISKNKILEGEYASSTSADERESFIKDNSSSEAQGKNDTLENYTRHMKGNSGVSATAQKMVEQYRDNIRNITNEIIKDLDPLFMGIW